MGDTVSPRGQTKKAAPEGAALFTGTGRWTGAVEPGILFPFFKDLVIDLRAPWAGAPDLGWLYLPFG
ncbi:MAG: hypothetical protein ACO3P8_10120, partial [Steroidobacteraceae bacterium]